MNATVHHLPEPPQVARPSAICTRRFVTIDLAAMVTGLSEHAIRNKIHKGVWLEDRQWVKRDGRVLIDLEGYDRWAETGQA